ncbi:MAG: spore germination protein [Desulfotomaculales bacterium]
MTGTPIDPRLRQTIAFMRRSLGIDKSFDIICREITFAGKKAALFFVDGLNKDQVVSLVLRTLAALRREDLGVNVVDRLFYQYVTYMEVDRVATYEEAIDRILAGPLAMFVDGEEEAIVMDVRQYPVRQPEEPDLEKVVRGSRDGFTETLVYNTALIRRRIRDPHLRMERLTAGLRSRTDIVLAYIEGVASPDLVDTLKGKIKGINIDGLPMAEKSVEELLVPGTVWNPYPRVRYTERPDVAAVHLLEGHVLILVDTSPSVMILPVTFFHHLQHAEEFRQNPAVGVYLRWVRFFGVFISLVLLPLWLLLALEPGYLPAQLKFIGPAEPPKIPLFWQFLLAELAVDMIRMATIHTPTPLATSTGIIAAVLLGEMAIRMGLFAAEVVLYTALAAIGTFLTPSYELANANRLVRLFLLAAVAVARLPGLIAGLLIALLVLGFTRSFGVPYLWPLVPFNWPALKNVLLRPPVPLSRIRPSIVNPRDRYRQPGPAAR